MADKKNPYDKTSGQRQGALLTRLREGGGKPVRVDTAGDDLALLDDLVASGYAASRSEAYRKSMREAHKKMARKRGNA